MILSALNINPLVSVGPYVFNMTRQSVRKIGGLGFRSFQRSAKGQLTDIYENALFFNFDMNDRLEAIEMTSLASPTYIKMELLKLSFEEAIAYLRNHDPKLAVEIDGAVSLSLGISLYAPLVKEKFAAPVESMLAFRQGYYD